jgi:thiaminase
MSEGCLEAIVLPRRDFLIHGHQQKKKKKKLGIKTQEFQSRCRSPGAQSTHRFLSQCGENHAIDHSMSLFFCFVWQIHFIQTDLCEHSECNL